MATKTITGDKFIEAIGRRKTAIARARLTPSARSVVSVNNKDINAYFPTQALQVAAMEPFLKVQLPTQFAVTIVVSGGGIEFMRPWTEKAYGIPPEQVVGSSVRSVETSSIPGYGCPISPWRAWRRALMPSSGLSTVNSAPRSRRN